MQELYAWLNEQNGNIGTYRAFRERTATLAHQDGANAALYELMGSIAARFEDKYAGEPLPVNDAHAALQDLRSIVARASELAAADAQARLDFANEIAIRELSIN